MRVEFTGFAADCTITGEIELGVERLKDQLDQDPGLVVLNATLKSLDDGHEICVPSLEFDRDDLLAAVAYPPRGSEARRIRTVRHRVLAEVGPFTITGDLHERPGSPLLSGFHTSRPLVSFTDAQVTFLRAGRKETRRVATLLVNRDRVDHVAPDMSGVIADHPILHGASPRTEMVDPREPS